MLRFIFYIKKSIIKMMVIICSKINRNFRYEYKNELNLLMNNFDCFFSVKNSHCLLRNVIEFDSSVNLWYYEFDGKKLYLKHKSKIEAENYIHGLLIEQNVFSPHRYETDDFKCLSEDILCDIGAAEAFFALTHVDHVRHCFIFECDSSWLYALRKTFEYYDNVTIVNKKVSNKNSGNFICLNDYFEKCKNQSFFIKMDIEGDERYALEGGVKLFNENRMKFSVCCYHKYDDADVLSHFFSLLGFSWSFSDGFMFPWFFRDFKYPWFRRGIIRASNMNLRGE